MFLQVSLCTFVVLVYESKECRCEGWVCMCERGLACWHAAVVRVELSSTRPGERSCS